MKRIFIPLLISIVSCQVSFAKQVDQVSAQNIGANFLATQGKQVKSADLSLAYQATSQVNGSSVTDFYVFNAGSTAFVIVSGDDKVTPVLAYGLEDAFVYNKNYSNINGWIKEYSASIASIIGNNDCQATAATKSEWSSLSKTHASAARTTSVVVGPLVKCKWNQSPYVNQLCPYDHTDSSLVVTGCVATAMAQVMKYWGWPVTGTGTNTYSSPYGPLTADYAAATYKWDSMPLVVSDTNLYVAQLMLDAGISVDMNYGVTGSSAGFDIPSSGTVCAEYALQTYFEYQPSTMASFSRDSYDDSTWVHMLQAEVDAKRPLLYDGFGAAGGHAFIMDGYSTKNNMMHLNWGWGGIANGYYFFENLNPTGETFNEYQHAIIGIMPDTVTIAPVPPAPSGVNTVGANTAVSVYPNPATDVVNIALTGIKVTDIRVTDLEGRVLMTATPAASATSVALSTKNLASGTYLIQLQTFKGLMTEKIVVAK